MSNTTDLLPFVVRMIDFEADSAHEFERASQISSHFRLTEPLNEEDLAEILDLAAKGIVYADMNPFMADVWGERVLTVALSAADLDRILQDLADEI